MRPNEAAAWRARSRSPSRSRGAGGARGAVFERAASGTTAASPSPPAKGIAEGSPDPPSNPGNPSPSAAAAASSAAASSAAAASFSSSSSASSVGGAGIASGDHPSASAAMARPLAVLMVTAPGVTRGSTSPLRFPNRVGTPTPGTRGVAAAAAASTGPNASGECGVSAAAAGRRRRRRVGRASPERPDGERSDPRRARARRPGRGRVRELPRPRVDRPRAIPRRRRSRRRRVRDVAFASGGSFPFLQSAKLGEGGRARALRRGGEFEPPGRGHGDAKRRGFGAVRAAAAHGERAEASLIYTSDAADEYASV